MIILRLLLRLLPREFRREYAADVLRTVEQQWREEGATLDGRGRLRFWCRQWYAVIRLGVDRRRRRPVLGGADVHHQHHRELGMNGVWKDVTHAARSLVARPGFTIVAVLTLGLGVGTTTAMFSAVHAILLTPLPYEHTDDAVVLTQTNTRDGTTTGGISTANVRDVAATAQTLTAAAVAEAHGLRLVQDGKAVSLRGWLVTEGFFDVIGGHAVLGRLFVAEEFVPGRERVVALSHQAWQTRFGGDSAVVGRELVLDGVAHTVVGVLTSDFAYPSTADLWGPRPFRPGDDAMRGRVYLDGVARLAPGVSAAVAQDEVDRLAARLAERHPVANAHLGLRVIPLRDYLVSEIESPLLLLSGAVGLVLLIAAANVAGLQLARGTGRSREFALRQALGAGRSRLLRLVTVESLLLAGAGCVLGIGLTHLGVDFIRLVGPDHLPRIDEVRVDGAVLAFAVVAATVSALVAALVPAFRAAKTDLQVALTDAARGTTGGARAVGLRDRLVVAEIAVALVLTIGAGLLVRSFARLLENDLGFEPAGRLAAQVWAYDDDHVAQLDFFRRAVEEIQTVPGVEAVGLTTDLPLANDRSVLSRGSAVRFALDGYAYDDEPTAALALIDNGYAAALGITVRAGRSFSAQDHARSAPVVMVNEAFVRRFLPDREPIGQRITLRWRNGASREIVGVLGDVRRRGFESFPRPEAYAPLSQEPSNGLTFIVKTGTDPAALTADVQEAMWAADPRQATWATRPMSDLLGDWNRQRSFNTALLVIFAGLALSLAAIGVYGLMSYSVEQRVNEIGIRRALGGQTRHIVTMVLRRGLTLALVGVGLGLVGSAVVTRLLEGMLFDVDPVDPLTFGALAVFVVVVALLAALLPARRATGVDPMVALRTQ